MTVGLEWLLLNANDKTEFNKCIHKCAHNKKSANMLNPAEWFTQAAKSPSRVARAVSIGVGLLQLESARSGAAVHGRSDFHFSLFS